MSQLYIKHDHNPTYLFLSSNTVPRSELGFTDFGQGKPILKVLLPECQAVWTVRGLKRTRVGSSPSSTDINLARLSHHIEKASSLCLGPSCLVNTVEILRREVNHNAANGLVLGFCWLILLLDMENCTHFVDNMSRDVSRTIKVRSKTVCKLDAWRS